MSILFYGELSDPSDFSKELLQEFLDTGYAIEQYINGRLFIRMTNLYYEDLGEYIIEYPKELCRDYWNKLVEDTKNCDVVGFVKRLCETHTTVKKLTDNKVDFLEMIGEELL